MRLARWLFACATLAAGCAAPIPTQPPGTTAAPTPAAALTASASAEAPTATDFSSSELCPGGTGHGCRLAMGEHHSLGFGDGIAFALDGDWIADANETDVISLRTGLDTNPQILELVTGAPRFWSSTDPTGQAPLTDPGAARTQLAAQATAGFLKVTIVERPAVRVAGLDGVSFDVVATDTITLFDYPVTWYPPSVLGGGRTASILWYNDAGAPFVVSIESDSRTFDAFAERVQPILASIGFGD